MRIIISKQFNHYEKEQNCNDDHEGDSDDSCCGNDSDYGYDNCDCENFHQCSEAI